MNASSNPGAVQPKKGGHLLRNALLAGAVLTVCVCGGCLGLSYIGNQEGSSAATDQAGTAIVQRSWTPTPSLTPLPTVTATVTPTPAPPTNTMPPKTATALAQSLAATTTAAARLVVVAQTATAKAVNAGFAAATQTQAQSNAQATARVQAYRNAPPSGAWQVTVDNITVGITDLKYVPTADGQRYVAFRVSIRNDRTFRIHVDPSTLLLSDLDGNSHQIDPETNKLWSEPLGVGDISNGVTGFGGVVFKMPATTGPAKFVYNDFENGAFVTAVLVDLTLPPPTDNTLPA